MLIEGAAPQASERLGGGDPQVAALVEELSGSAPGTKEQVATIIDAAFPRDFACKAETQPSVLHRKAGSRDVYFVYGAAKATECTFRASGRVELWDPWTGGTAELPVLKQSAAATKSTDPVDAWKLVKRSKRGPSARRRRRWESRRSDWPRLVNCISNLWMVINYMSPFLLRTIALAI